MDTNERRGRTLVMCFDGTAGQFDGDVRAEGCALRRTDAVPPPQNTNVVKIFSLLKKDEPDKQLVYYQVCRLVVLFVSLIRPQPGIGTFAKPGVLTPAFLWAAKMVDMAVACYLDEHVLGGYTFLMQNYQPGGTRRPILPGVPPNVCADRIVMFGFSRGAYTTRALAGMLHKVGLLPRDNLHNAPFAYAMYRRNDEIGFAQSRAFKQTFSRDVEIDFIGLWDTVSSVGLLRPRRLPFTSSNSTVKMFRHALALDERRARFRPTLWSHTTPSADRPNPPKWRRRDNASAPVSPATSPAAPPSLHIIAESESIGTGGAASIATGGRSPMRPLHVPLPGEDLHAMPQSETAVAHPAEETEDEKNEPAQTTKKKNKWPRIPFLRRRVKCEIEEEFGREREFDERSADDSERWRAHAGSPTPGARKTDVLEVWFSGNHSDIGGGNVPDTQPHMLSNVPLHWMVREAVLAQTGLIFESAALARLGMQLGAFALTSPTARAKHLHPHAPRERADSGLGISLGVPDAASPALSRSVSREDGAETDHAAVAHAFRPPRAPTSSSLQLNVYGDDALCPWTNELKRGSVWWGLELLPYEYWYQNTRYKWRRTLRYVLTLTSRMLALISVARAGRTWAIRGSSPARRTTRRTSTSASSSAWRRRSWPMCPALVGRGSRAGCSRQSRLCMFRICIVRCMTLQLDAVPYSGPRM